MPNNKIDTNNFYLLQAKKRSTIQITLCIIVVILTVAAILTVLAWGSNGFINWNLPEWFNGWGTNATQAVEGASEQSATAGNWLLACAASIQGV